MSRLKSFYILVLAVGAMLLNSCGTSAHIEKDPAINLANYRTYSWTEKDNNITKKKSHLNDMAEQNVKSAVNAELQKHGLREVTSDPDVLLSYDLVIERSVSQQRDPVYSQPYTRTYFNPYTRRFGTIYYPSQFLGYDTYDIPVKEGTVMISMIDPKMDKTIWQGWATKQLNSNRITAEDVQKNVKSIFKKFDTANK
jgi:hypothetical protein